MIFKASLDKMSKGITIGITLLFLLSAVTCLVIFYMDQLFSLLIIPVILITSYFLVFFLRPVSYSVTDQSININRLAGVKEIMREHIKSVTVISKDKIDSSIRTFGVGGLFGYFGKFYNRQFGKMTWYITRMDKLVLIVTSEKKNIVLSPDEPEQFIAAL